MKKVGFIILKPDWFSSDMNLPNIKTSFFLFPINKLIILNKSKKIVIFVEKYIR